MSNYLKPQSPMYHKKEDTYFYPLTTSDQVIIDKDNRLNSLFKKTIKENITLSSSNWSDTLPYTQTITLNHSTDDYNIDANIMYDGSNDASLNKAAGCISYIKKNHKEISFYCLKKKPDIDIPVEISGTCRNTIATIEEGVKLNFEIVAYATEEEMLVDTPAENTIGVITDVEITGYKFGATEPENMVEGEVWIKIGTESDVAFDIVDDVTTYPLSAKQMVSGALVNVTAMSYQNGEWTNWVFRIPFTSANFEKVIGFPTGNSYTIASGTFSNDAYSVNLPTSPYSGTLALIEKLDVTDISTIQVRLEMTAANDGLSDFRLGLYSKKNLETVNKIANKTVNGQYNGYVTLDVQTIEGEYYVVLGVNTWSGGSCSAKYSEFKYW